MNYLSTPLDRKDELDAYNLAYENLDQEEKGRVDKCAIKVRQHLLNKAENYCNIATEKSLRELIAKIGIWMIQNKKGK